MSIAATRFGSTDPDAPTMLAVHGITANSMAWSVVAGMLPGWRVIAVDLRGRGRSGGLPGPFGLRRHADDLSEFLDAEGVSRAVVVGHSMGGFVAVAFAARRPDAVSALVLVDGGIPLELPEGSQLADLPSLLGPAAERLGMVFADEDEYIAFWRRHPAFAADWRPEIAEYARYDLTGTAPNLRPAASAEAMLADGAELYGPDWYLDALRGITVPVEVLRAPRGLLDDTPLYPPGRIEAATALVPHLRVTEVADVNHYTILFADRGAAEVADAISRTKEYP